MSYPHDRPSQEPGGMECYECGVIFVGGMAHDQCAVCANNGWRPIDTAPHATVVLLFSPATDFQEACIESGWASGGQRVGDYSSLWLHGTATHWQPLPKPPVSA